MAEKVTAIIDIGKTNKKFFLFDENLNEIAHEYASFDEVPDDDGFLSENLSALVKWMEDCIHGVIRDPQYELKNINFSTYGASLAHLDEDGWLVTPFYNYLKPIEEWVLESFFEKYGDRKKFSSVTSSPIMGLLNSGFQLYYLKCVKPEMFEKIRYSLHFPQYLSSIFTGHMCSDYTSIGCHTALWNFQDKDYHEWVNHEGIRYLFPQILPSDHSFNTSILEKPVSVGIGVHDSSSALVPYIQSSGEPFVLISTGTWSICMNYFNEKPLTIDELDKDCLNFLSAWGTNVKASRLFLGKEISHQAGLLGEHFSRGPLEYEAVKFDPAFSSKRINHKKLLFNYELLRPERFGLENNKNPDFSIFESYENAYHHLMDELTDLQISSLRLAIGDTDVGTVYLDGGFSSNEVFMQMLANKLPEYRLLSSSFAKGTALGAAILVNKARISPDFLKKNYDLKINKPMTYS